MFSALIVTAFAIAAVHGAPPRDENIGVVDAITIGSRLHEASLEYRGKHVCSGIILNSLHILTTARCASFPPGDLLVRAGSSFADKGGETREVMQIIPHENFTDNGHGFPVFDVALLTLEKELELNGTRFPEIRLFDAEASPGAAAVVTGWNITADSGNYFSDLLQTASTRIVGKEECSQYYANSGGLRVRQICAESVKGSCQGGLGSGLTIGGRLAGIASYKAGCSDDTPTVYSEIASFVPWISVMVRF